MNTLEYMKLFMEPRSVAIIGLSRRAGRGSPDILDALKHMGFQGEIYPVNPHANNIGGTKAYPDMASLPVSPDVAVIVTPRHIVPQVVKDCVEKGIKAITVFAQGFADADARGKELQEEVVVRIARRGGARVMGPNTVGSANPYVGFTSGLARLDFYRLPTGFIAQSGSLVITLADWGILGKSIDLGNTCDIDFADALEYFEDDPQVKVVGIHMEGLSNAKRFIEVAGRFVRKKPLIVLKTGRSEQGTKAARSHSGSIAGSHETYSAIFNQLGILRAADLEELGDLMKAFAFLPAMAGRRVGVAAHSGGAGIIAVDVAERYGIEMPHFAPETIAALKPIFPEWQTLDNPLDTWPAVFTSGHPSYAYKACLQAVLADESVDGVFFTAAAFNRAKKWSVSEPVLEAAEKFSDKPIVCCLQGPLYVRETGILEKTQRIACFPSPDRAIRALARMADYAEFKREQLRS